MKLSEGTFDLDAWTWTPDEGGEPVPIMSVGWHGKSWNFPPLPDEAVAVGEELAVMYGPYTGDGGDPWRVSEIRIVEVH